MLPPDEADRQVRGAPPEICPDCYATVLPDEGKPIRHQVFEVPPLTAQATEYVRERGCCMGCGHRHQPPGYRVVSWGRERGPSWERWPFHLSRAKVRNLLGLWPALWHFLDDPAVPPTNNAAERALRGFVIRRKLSYFTRSGRGLRFIEHTFSAVQTCRLQGRNAFDYMTQALTAWTPGPHRLRSCRSMSAHNTPPPERASSPQAASVGVNAYVRWPRRAL